MLKSKTKYRFIKDIEKAKEIFGAFITTKGERITEIHVLDDGEYSVNIDRTVKMKADRDRRLSDEWMGSSSFDIVNEFEVKAKAEFLDDKLATKILRTHQTKTMGEEYVNALKEYLRKQTEAEIQNYQKLLEPEAK